MRLAAIGRAAAALTLAMLLISLVLLALGVSPAGVFIALYDGAFGDWLAVTDTLVKSAPLLFCGLAIAIAFEGALWNIGADGQLIVGALIAGAVGPMLVRWPHPAAITAILLTGACGGGAWGAIAGWLRARRQVNEVISTIMLNFIAAQLLSWAVHGPLIESSHAYPKSAPIARSAQLQLYFSPSRLNLGMLLAVMLALLCYVFMFHTEAGFELRAMGRNRQASAFFGIPTARLTLGAMALSGAIAGLGGAVQISAITHRLYETISPGWGYEAIAVALIARLNPLGVVPASILFGALDNGAQAMQRAQGISPVLVQVIQGLVIMALLGFDAAAALAIRHIGRAAPAMDEETPAEAVPTPTKAIE
jgi:general nucleoside transport system permease protein